mgnify:CR=1 FL=1
MNWVSTTENEKWSKNNEFSDRKGEELIISEKQGKTAIRMGMLHKLNMRKGNIRTIKG